MKKYNVKVTNKNLIEMLIGKLIIFLLEIVLGIGLVLGFFWLMGCIELFVETHAWAWIPLIIIALWSIFSMVKDSE